jgi:biopolymer transport protein ExbD/biopolymer transport protein TolR
LSAEEEPLMAFTTAKGKTQTSLSEINVTPFVDVVLVLLIIFMITAPILESGIEVDLPKTKTVRSVATERVVRQVPRGRRS